MSQTRLMRLPDVLPSGQTGWDLTRRQRFAVRTEYRAARMHGHTVRRAQAAAVFLARQLSVKDGVVMIPPPPSTQRTPRPLTPQEAWSVTLYRIAGLIQSRRAAQLQLKSTPRQGAGTKVRVPRTPSAYMKEIR